MSYPYHPFYLSKIIKTQKIYFLVIWTTGVQFLPEIWGSFLFTDTARKFQSIESLTRWVPVPEDFPMWQTRWQSLNSISCLQRTGTNNIYGLRIILKRLNTCNTKKLISIKETDATLGSSSSSSSSSSLWSSVICQTTGPKPLPKRFLHIVRSRDSSFNWH